MIMEWVDKAIWRRKTTIFYMVSVASFVGNMVALVEPSDLWRRTQALMHQLILPGLGSQAWGHMCGLVERLVPLAMDLGEVLMQRPVLYAVLNAILFTIVFKSGLLRIPQEGRQRFGARHVAASQDRYFDTLQPVSARHVVERHKATSAGGFTSVESGFLGRSTASGVSSAGSDIAYIEQSTVAISNTGVYIQSSSSMYTSDNHVLQNGNINVDNASSDVYNSQHVGDIDVSDKQHTVTIFSDKLSAGKVLNTPHAGSLSGKQRPKRDGLLNTQHDKYCQPAKKTVVKRASLFTIEPLDAEQPISVDYAGYSGEEDGVSDVGEKDNLGNSENNRISAIINDDDDGLNRVEFKERVEGFISRFKKDLNMQREASFNRLMNLLKAKR